MKVLFFGSLRQLVGEKELVVDEHVATVGDLLRTLTERYGDEVRPLLFDGVRPNAGVVVLVDGIDARRLGGQDATLNPENTIYLVPPTSGGENSLEENDKRGL